MSAEALTSGDSVPESYRWTIGLLLAAGVLVNYFDRVNLSVSHDALVKRSFNITPTAFGQLSAAYSWTYARLPAAHGRGAGQLRCTQRSR